MRNLILERLQLRKTVGHRAPTVDELMALVTKDVHVDHPDIGLADIAAAFRDVQRSDEGRRLANELVREPNSANVDRHTMESATK